jgi:hypothetical protein
LPDRGTPFAAKDEAFSQLNSGEAVEGLRFPFPGPLPGHPWLDAEAQTVSFDADRALQGAHARIARDAVVELPGGEERLPDRTCARPGCGAPFVGPARNPSSIMARALPEVFPQRPKARLPLASVLPILAAVRLHVDVVGPV